MHIFEFLVMLSSMTLCDGARILALLPVNSRSHFLVMEPLLLALQERGHHLTVISSFPRKNPLNNYIDVDLSSRIRPNTSNFSLNFIRKKMPNLVKSPLFYVEFHNTLCEPVLGHEKVLNLLNEKFDLVIGEIFGSDCFNYFTYKSKVPLISWVASTNLPWVSGRAGFPDNPSYIPNFFVGYSFNMDLFQRVYNAVSLFYEKAIYTYYSEPLSHKIAEKVFGEKLPPMNEVNKQTSLVLVNSHFSLSQSRPFPPNVVEVGGIHIKEPNPLPKDIKEFLDSAKDGVILFSFGSLVRLSSLPPQVIRAFMHVFAILPQRVILKYEEELPDVSPNVMYRKWLPQSDIIAHPNVRAVITHGGQASTFEAVHYAKPLIAIPFYGDQFQNANNVAHRRAGVMLDIDRLSEQAITQALNTVLVNPSYTENMRRLSQRFRDRPMTAMETAVYWTEYVIRHKGAPHLQPASVHLPLYQYLLLDVIAVLGISLIAVFYVLYFIIRRTFARKNSEVLKEEVNKKID